MAAAVSNRAHLALGRPPWNSARRTRRRRRAATLLRALLAAGAPGSDEDGVLGGKKALSPLDASTEARLDALDRDVKVHAKAVEQLLDLVLLQVDVGSLCGRLGLLPPQEPVLVELLRADGRVDEVLEDAVDVLAVLAAAAAVAIEVSQLIAEDKGTGRSAGVVLAGARHREGPWAPPDLLCPLNRNSGQLCVGSHLLWGRLELLEPLQQGRPSADVQTGLVSAATLLARSRVGSEVGRSNPSR